MYYVYVLENKESSHYIGYTNNLQRRIKDHNYSKNISTKKKGPWHLVYKEDAFLRERQIKRYKGGEAFKQLLS